MDALLSSGLAYVGLLLAVLAMLELGRWIGKRRAWRDPDWDTRGVGTLENMLLALLGLLLAFTFSGAWSRFDARRELILHEANAIGTAWLRLDLLDDPLHQPARQHLRDSFRRYVELRIADTRAEAARPSPAVTACQEAIWREAVAAARSAPDNRITQSLLPALNDMFDLATARHQAVLAHPPIVVYLMLLANLLLASLLAGHGMAGSSGRNWLHIFCFVCSLLLAIYVSIDLEFPRQGLIRIDRYDQLMVDVRDSMK